jgi:hypothetical protein
MTEQAKEVYAAIAAVMSDMASEGISKGRRNQQQGYNFRGIDDVYNALAPILAKHKLLILPRVMARSQVERTTAKGGVLFYTTVEVEFDLVSGVDGSSHTIKTVGEAMDSADKSSNKAMSAAFKYAAMQAFCIPTEGDNDADATTHEVSGNITPEQVTALQADLVSVGADVPAFLKLFRVDRVEQLNAADLPRAKAMIEAKRKKAEAAQLDEAA